MLNRAQINPILPPKMTEQNQKIRVPVDDDLVLEIEKVMKDERRPSLANTFNYAAARGLEVIRQEKPRTMPIYPAI